MICLNDNNTMILLLIKKIVLASIYAWQYEVDISKCIPYPLKEHIDIHK